MNIKENNKVVKKGTLKEKYKYNKKSNNIESIDKKILKMLIILSSIIVLALTILFAIFKSYDTICTEISFINIILNQTLEGIHNHEKSEAIAKDLFIEDYVSRVNHIDKMINLDNDGIITESELKQMAKDEKISNIYIVSNEGIIIQSSDSDSVGLDFYKNQEMDTFIPLIESKDKDYYCEFSRNSVVHNKHMIYLMVRNDDEKLIQIEIEPITLDNYLNSSGIETYIKEIPTRKNRTIFVIDSNTEELISITNNNEQKLEGENLIEKFKKAENKVKIVKVNGIYQLLLTRKVSENLILGELSQLPRLCKMIINNTIVFFVLTIVFVSVILLFIYNALNKLVIRDILKINKDILLFTQGNNIRISDSSTKELSMLSTQLNRLIARVIDSKEQLELSISVLGDKYTGYEYYADYNRIYYSKNCIDVVGLSKEECDRKVKDFFNENRPKEHESKNITTIIKTKHGKILKVNRYITHNILFAIVQDVTDEESEKEKIYIDELTGLFNRKKIVQCIENHKKQNLNGIILILDLDNFKMVNDTFGHLEGDNVLRKISNILKQQFRSSDVVARIGGDEFMIFLPSYIECDSLSEKLENLMNSIRCELSYYYEEVNLSTSIGAIYLSNKYNSFNEIYNQVDKIMYSVKHNGKNGFKIQI